MSGVSYGTMSPFPHTQGAASAPYTPIADPTIEDGMIASEAKHVRFGGNQYYYRCCESTVSKCKCIAKFFCGLLLFAAISSVIIYEIYNATHNNQWEWLWKLG